jgi:hypothetical protein
LVFVNDLRFAKPFYAGGSSEVYSIAKDSRRQAMKIKGSWHVLIFLALPLFAMGPQILAAQQVPSAGPDDTKLDDIIKETQQTIGGKDVTGFVWWLPTEFWEQSAIQEGTSVDRAKETFGAMREYTMVIVAVGKIGIGSINWRSEDDIRANTTLRDSDGKVYQPLKEISQDAKGIVLILKPILANILGPTGQNLQVLFFPAKTAKGTPIADPSKVGTFSVVMTNLTSKKEAEFVWRLPLSSLSPPKYCSVGRERVEANWKFCPWHGNRLEDTPPAPNAAELLKKSEKP